jgi:hypothetical protein
MEVLEVNLTVVAVVRAFFTDVSHLLTLVTVLHLVAATEGAARVGR